MIELLSHNDLKILLVSSYVTMVIEWKLLPEAPPTPPGLEKVKSVVYLINGTQIFVQNTVDEVHTLIRGY